MLQICTTPPQFWDCWDYCSRLTSTHIARAPSERKHLQIEPNGPGVHGPGPWGQTARSQLKHFAVRSAPVCPKRVSSTRHVSASIRTRANVIFFENILGLLCEVKKRGKIRGNGATIRREKLGCQTTPGRSLSKPVKLSSRDNRSSAFLKNLCRYVWL